MEFRRFKGEKYEQHRQKPITEIAKLIREDIKAAIVSGEIPKAKYSVRVHKYSGGRSINVVIKGAPFEIYGSIMECGPAIFTEEARRVKEVVEAIRNAYNYDNSDAMTDFFSVHYYGATDYDSRELSEEYARKLAA
jgi:hypothetical protein